MKPSLQKIIWADYLTLIALLFPAIFWLIYIDSITLQVMHLIFRRSDGPLDPAIFFRISLICSVIFVPIFFYRVKAIYDHFAQAETVLGTITYIRLFKDRGRLEYFYEYHGEEYRSGNAVHKNKFVASLTIGDVVELAVSRKQPKKALIKKLYLK